MFFKYCVSLLWAGDKVGQNRRRYFVALGVCVNVCIVLYIKINNTLQWRHNGISNHQPHDCLLNRLFRRRSTKTSKLRVTGLCAGNSPVTGEFPAQMTSYAENVFFFIWWRHHVSQLAFTISSSGPYSVQWQHLHVGWERTELVRCKKPTIVNSSPPWTKWPPFCWRYFQKHFCEWKISYFH